MSDDHLSDNLLNEYLDSFLSAEARWSVENHLMGCDVCTARFEMLNLLFAELDHLPDLRLERDLSQAVLRTVHPVEILPRRWQWALWGQLGLAVWLFALAIPTLMRSELFLNLQLYHLQASEILNRFSEMFIRPIYWIKESLFQLLNNFQAIHLPELPFSLVVLMPILLATGLLWLVGNGLLLKNKT
jgi:hypothetical protein